MRAERHRGQGALKTVTLRISCGRLTRFDRVRTLPVLEQTANPRRQLFIFRGDRGMSVIFARDLILTTSSRPPSLPLRAMAPGPCYVAVHDSPGESGRRGRDSGKTIAHCSAVRDGQHNTFRRNTRAVTHTPRPLPSGCAIRPILWGTLPLLGCGTRPVDTPTALGAQPPA